MSNDHIELQKIIRRSPSSPDRMSATGSFGQPSSTTFNNQNIGDTVVGQMAPLYQTVPDAKVSHAKYTAGRIPSPTPGGLYTTPSESDPPNEYDFINEKPGRTQHVSENVLYGDQVTAGQFRHAATLEKKDSRFSGSVSEAVKEPGAKESTCGCQVSTMFFSFFHVVGIVIGLTALILVVLIIFGLFSIGSPNCDCTSNDQEVQDLRAMVSRLMETLDDLQQNTTASQNSINNTLDQLTQNVETINSTGIAAQVNRILDTRISGVGLPESFRANLTDVETHYNCTTTLEDDCPLASLGDSFIGSSPCATQDIPIDKAGFYTADVYCARTDENEEPNAVTAIIQVNTTSGLMRCLCNVVIANSLLPQSSNTVTCGMFVTRCPSVRTISTTILT